MSARRIVIPGAFNVRDLGGLPTTDGRTTRWGRFVRSDLLSGLPDEAREALFAYGVRTVVDLRTTEETMQSPCSLAGDARFDSRHCNLQGDEPIPGFVLSLDSRKLARSYAAFSPRGSRRSAMYSQRSLAATGGRPCSFAPAALTVRG